jgi:hypothetical protein
MKKIALKYGLFMFAGFAAFFLLMHLIGLSQNTYLRVFNGVIHLGLIYTAIKAYRNVYEESVENYVSGVAVGMYTSAVVSTSRHTAAYPPNLFGGVSTSYFRDVDNLPNEFGGY